METDTMSDERLDTAERLLGTDYDAAIDLALLSLVNGEDVARAARIVGEAFEAKEMNEEALTYFDKSIAASPTAKAFAWRGWVRHKRNEHDAALADFERALAIDPANGLAL
jgi:tetratricopeptide (TPR) repeat protein